jgi:hypothetical protein
MTSNHDPDAAAANPYRPPLDAVTPANLKLLYKGRIDTRNKHES